MFVLILKPENQWAFGNYAEKKDGGKIYLNDLGRAKTFRTEEEAREWAGKSIDQFDIITKQ